MSLAPACRLFFAASNHKKKADRQCEDGENKNENTLLKRLGDEAPVLVHREAELRVLEKDALEERHQVVYVVLTRPAAEFGDKHLENLRFACGRLLAGRIALHGKQMVLLLGP